MISNIIKILSVFIVSIFLVTETISAPIGGDVIHGNAEIVTGGNHTNINQGSDKAIINWGSFDIGKGESVNFDQPSSSSVVLNKVTGGSPTEIYGKLTGNGNVFILNPNGMLIGSGASIETGSFLGSTANIKDSDFLNNNYIFSGATAGIKNEGSIKVNNKGFVALIGKNISNTGLISAGVGSVYMASGESFRLNFDRSGLIGLDITKGTIDAHILNQGVINGSSVIMTAKSASDMLTSVVNNSGIIKASGIENKGGKVVITGSHVVQNGKIDVSGATGGNVLIEGSTSVSIEKGSVTDASGYYMGGDIRFISKNLISFKKGSIAYAKSVYGSGGFIEVSGSRVAVAGIADTRSDYGKNGNFLIDPTDIIIMKNAPSGSLEGDFSLSGPSDISYIDMDYLNSQLAITNVEISTVGTSGAGKGDITVMGGAGSSITGSGLTLTSANDILIANKDITLSGDLNLNAAGSITSSALLNTGNLNATAGSIIDISAINNVANINAESLSGTVSLKGIGNLNISRAKGSYIYLSSDAGIQGAGIEGRVVNMAASNNIDVKISANKISASSDTGLINIENANIGDVVLDVLKTTNMAATYTQTGGGSLTLNNALDSGSGAMRINNEQGKIYADFDFVKEPSRDVILKAGNIYLTKADYNIADIDTPFINKVDTKHLDINAKNDIIISSDIVKPDMKLVLTSLEGGIDSGINRITVNSLSGYADKNITLLTDISSGDFISNNGNISITEKDSVDFSRLYAGNGKVNVTVENTGNLKINDIYSAQPVSVTTAADSKIDITANGQPIFFDIQNGLNNDIILKNNGNITISSWNMAGIKDLSIIANQSRIFLPVDNLIISGKGVLKGLDVNGGAELGITADQILLNLVNGGAFTILANKADISGGNFFINFGQDIILEDLDKDKLAFNTNMLVLKSINNISLANRGNSSLLDITSNNFIFSKFDSSIVANNVRVVSTGSISGTGRIIADDVYLQGDTIGVNSSILVDADHAIFYATSQNMDKTINVSAPDWFGGIKRYRFINNGLAYLNGRPVDKRIYALVGEASERNLMTYEDTNIGDIWGRYILNMGWSKKPTSMITSDTPEAVGATDISERNGKIELK